jgi:hypothetical protein
MINSQLFEQLVSLDFINTMPNYRYINLKSKVKIFNKNGQNGIDFRRNLSKTAELRLHL